MSVLDLVRPDLRDFGGYRSARSERMQGEAWLNANESPWPNPADPTGSLRRYPDPQPQALRERLAARYGCRPGQLLATRGSDEGIDLLVRALCLPGGGAIAITSPTFGMYAVCAKLHGARVVDVPLREEADGYACDFAALAAAVRRASVRLVFLCSPGNPGGSLVPLAEIAGFTREVRGTALVVVDEAYVEFAASPSAITLLAAHDNIAILRTLSKAHALAAARIGCVAADERLVDVLQRCQAPYPLPAPGVAAAMAALDDAACATTDSHVRRVCAERERLRHALCGIPGVRVAASRANFLLVRCVHASAIFDRLLDAGIVVRDVRTHAGLDDALRIGIGTPEQNDRVLAIVRDVVHPGERA